MKDDSNNTTASEETKKLAAIFNNSVDGIITIDQYGFIENINPAGTKLFGYTIEELIGKNVKILMHEPHHSSHDQHLSNYRKSQQSNILGTGREVAGKKKDGSHFPLRLSVSRIDLENGNMIYSGVLHDLSQQKEHEKKIRDLNKTLEKDIDSKTEELNNTVNHLLSINKKLKSEIEERHKIETALRKSEDELRVSLMKEKELNNLKTRFVTMTSHQFRTPLSTILSSAALIEKYVSTSQQNKREKHIDRIKSSAAIITGFLNDFLSMTKLEEGEIKITTETFLWEDLCNEVESELKDLFKKGQKIAHEKNSFKQNLIADKNLIKQIILNLLSNAIKYSPENKSIYCHSELIDNDLHINIKDQGIGIPKQDQVHLFSRFFRATNASNYQGTGLGLNIVKKYLDLLGGSISFESEEGVGTSFHLVIPVQTKHKEES